MTSRAKPDVGALNNNPAAGAAPPGAEVNVKDSPPAAGATAALTLALANALHAMEALDAALDPFYVEPAEGNPKRRTKVRRDREYLIPAMANLGRLRPVLVSVTATPDEIDAEVEATTGFRKLGEVLQRVSTKVGTTASTRIANAWTEGMAIYNLARPLAKRDRDVATALAPIQQGLRTGRLTNTTTRNSAAAQIAADKAATRAARAQHLADQAKRTQTLAEARAQNAHPDTHTPAASAPAAAPSPGAPATPR